MILCQQSPVCKLNQLYFLHLMIQRFLRKFYETKYIRTRFGSIV